MTRTPLPTTLDALRDLVRHRQPDPLRRRDPPPGRRAVAGGRRRPRRPAREGRLEAGAEGCRQHPSSRARGEHARRRRRRHRVDAHVQPRQDVDRGPRRPAEAAAAPAHAGERRAAVGGHRLRLHEPQPGRARRPRVRLHPDPARRRAQDRRRPRLEPGRPAAGRGLAARRRRLGGLALAQARALRRQHALRRGHRGRQDRGRAALRRAGQHVGRQRARRRGRRRATEADVDTLVAEYVDAYDVADELLPGRRPPPVAARRRGDRARAAVVPRGGRLRRLHDVVRRPRRAQAAARASPCSG